MNKSALLDIHRFYLIVISVCTLLSFNFLGEFGLVVYGVLLLYSVILFFYNKKMELYRPWILYVLIAYYIYFFIASCVNGSVVKYFGASCIQLLFLSLITFYRRDVDSCVNDFISIAKLSIILSLIMNIGSLVIGISVYFFPEMINGLPQFISGFFKNVAGNFPIRLAGFAFQPNSSARVCLLGTIFSIYLLTCEEKQNRKWYALAISNIIISLYYIVFATNSRTSLIVLFIFSVSYLFIYAFILKKGNKNILKIILLIAVILLALIVLVIIAISISPEIKEFLLNDIFRVSTISTGTGRTTVFKTALELGKGNRLFGFYPGELKERVGVTSTHNLFLELLSYGGIPSLVLYAIFFFYTLYVSYKNMKCNTIVLRERALCSLFFCYILSYFVCGMAENVSVMGSEEFGLISTLILCSTNMIRYEISKSAKSLKNVAKSIT